MKSNAPWSVKGIERDARETAKAAAQREGMTVGEWLNQTIYTAADPDAPATTGEIDGLAARDLASAIEHLAKRISAAEQKSAGAVDNLARSLGGAVERLQRLERAEPSSGGDSGLAERVRLLEEKSTDRQRIEALRALERAVGQIAVQFTHSEKSTVARLDAAERQMQTIAARLDERPAGETVSANAVREAIEGMASRVARAEKIASEAAALKSEAAESVDTDFIQKTGLRMRILGDEIKRGGDQIRNLEATIQRLTQQIDAAEKRSAEGVQKVAETIADLREKFANADATDQTAARAEIEAAVSEIAQRTEDRIETLQASFDDMVRRLEGSVQRAAPLQAAQPHVAAPQSSAPADDFDNELDDAFAALDLEEPAPMVVAREPEAIETIEEASADLADDFGDSLDLDDDKPSADVDEFGFEVDEPQSAGDEVAGDQETADVLAEIREAFGIDAPDDEQTDEEDEEGAAASGDDDIEFAEEPPIAEAPPAITELPAAGADYLKAARQAAREAAARAAEEEEAQPKRKLTPKQRAILAARLKRRKAEAEAAEKAAAEAKVAIVAEPVALTNDVDDSDDEKPSVKARVAALVAKIKLRAPSKKEAAPQTDDAPSSAIESDDDEKPAKAPNLLAGFKTVTARFEKIPNAGGILGLAAGIVLAALAAVFFLKDAIGGKPQRQAPAPAVVSAEPTQTAPASSTGAASDERLAPVGADNALVRPRELYLENIAALKNATTDADAKAALVHIEEAAALGHPPAQLQIGELYKLGQLYDRDLGQARMWFERAANGGNVLAMHRLGVMSARGEGGPVDPAISVSWFEKAANLGLVDSQYNLGATYHPTPDGAAGGVQDRNKAYYWYSIAAKNGDAQAGEMAAGLASSLGATDRATLDAEVAAWAPKSPDPAANELAPAE